MKIRALPNSGSALILGNDLAREFISEYAPDLAAKTEEVHFFGADYPLILAHNFGANVRAWKVDREHKDAAAAFLFAEQHPAAVPLTCTLEITDDSGAVVYLAATRDQARPVSRNGQNTIFQYRFLCGVAQTTPPKTS